MSTEVPKASSPELQTDINNMSADLPESSMSTEAAGANSEVANITKAKYEVANNTSELFLDGLYVDLTGTIVVMICRMWDVSAVTGRYLSTDFVVSDAKGNAIHCTAKAFVAHNFLRLKGGGIYSIKNFVVLPNKEDYRIRKYDTFILEFDGSTSVRKALVKPDGFVRYPFQLVDHDSMQPTDNKYIIG